LLQKTVKPPIKNSKIIILMLGIFCILIFQLADTLPLPPKEKEIIIPTTQQVTLPLLIHPLEKSKMSSKTGNRFLLDEEGFHRGLDLVALPKSIVYAIADGEVILSYPAPHGKYKGHPIYGGFVVIKHEYNLYSLYGHLNDVWVAGKTKIKQGDPLGVIGDTGYAFGNHLHFEVVFNPEFLMNFLENE
jgi:murein DD-endopeptidase MepM/ murein hydrolase activator NlpD